MTVQEIHAASVEQVLQQSEALTTLLTPADRAGRWRASFGDAAARIPDPYWLFNEDEQTRFVLGYPLRVTGAWEGVRRELARLAEAEALYRCAVARAEPTVKASLVDHRVGMAKRLSELFENAWLYDHGRRFSEILWLAVSREIEEAIRLAMRSVIAHTSTLPPRTLDEVRYAAARRLADVALRAETDALGRLRRNEGFDARLPTLAFSRQLSQDLLPFVEHHLGQDLRELDGYLQAVLHVEPTRFRQVLSSLAAQVEALRQRDSSFERALALLDEEAGQLPSERLLFCPALLDLLPVWQHPETPRPSGDLIKLLKELSARLKRLEVVNCLRRRIFLVDARGTRMATRVQGQEVRLSAFTRPLDYTMPGVVESTVRRYGLLYDLVEFTQLLEELRRRGHTAEEGGLRAMSRFQRHVEEIRARYRLRFEKFLGDGAFFSSRSARTVLSAAAELRVLYESFRRLSFPFDRGLRIAVNVGAYHLLPMSSGGENPRFEFFGHGLVELARLTSGKTTHEVEDLADFLISSGYDVHRVLDFLEPVRRASRFPDHVRERPYAAFLAENNELVNLGAVATEAFLRDLEAEWSGPLGHAERWGLRWLMMPVDRDRPAGPWVGLRSLGTARLKGLTQTPVAEMAVFDEPPAGLTTLPEEASLLRVLQELAAGDTLQAGVSTAVAATGTQEEIDPHLCVISVLDGARGDGNGYAPRHWFIGLYNEDEDALINAYQVALNPVDVQDGEPYEAFLFRQRHELSRLYQGLLRETTSMRFRLEALRAQDGYLTCLLVAPHRSPR